VLLSGRTAWVNPYGYLPAELYNFLPFFRAMAGAYFCLGLVWTALCVRHRALLLQLQIYIGGVIALGLLETVRLKTNTPNYKCVFSCVLKSEAAAADLYRRGHRPGAP